MKRGAAAAAAARIVRGDAANAFAARGSSFDASRRRPRLPRGYSAETSNADVQVATTAFRYLVHAAAVARRYGSLDDAAAARTAALVLDYANPTGRERNLPAPRGYEPYVAPRSSYLPVARHKDWYAWPR